MFIEHSNQYDTSKMKYFLAYDTLRADRQFPDLIEHLLSTTRFWDENQSTLSLSLSSATSNNSGESKSDTLSIDPPNVPIQTAATQDFEDTITQSIHADRLMVLNQSVLAKRVIKS